MSLALEPPVKHRVALGRTKTLRVKRRVFQQTLAISSVSTAHTIKTTAILERTNRSQVNRRALMQILATTSAVTA